MTFRELFCRHYDVIRRTYASATMSGVTVIAINRRTGMLKGRLWIAARVRHAGSAIIGRHGLADLFLDGDESLALRHLMMIVEPLEADSDDVCFRLIDLRTANAFEDERGRRLEALVSEGPMFVRCGDYYVYFLITGKHSELPESADDGWDCIPPRVYLDEVAADPDRQRRRRRRMRQTAKANEAMGVADTVHAVDAGEYADGSDARDARDAGDAKESGDAVDAPEVSDVPDAPDMPDMPDAPDMPDMKQSGAWGSDRITRVSVVRGLARPQMRLLEDGERPAGTLRIRTAAGEQRVLVGIAALHRGILIGRYDRCDIEESSLLYNENISRVHLVLMMIGDRVYAIDTASTNATCLRGDNRKIDIEPLDSSAGGSAELVLGEGLASVFWSPSCEAQAS